MASYPNLKIHVYVDGAHKEDMIQRAREGFVKGFTTNPSLVAKAGVKNYTEFARSLLSEIRDLPISFEVFSDEPVGMEREALVIADWGANVYVKIPIINTQGELMLPLIRKLLDRKLRLNVTVIFTQEQLDGLRKILKPEDDVLVSIFAGRIADTGVDPLPLMRKAVEDYRLLRGSKILWASTRETLNIYQADQIGCHVITATADQISKLPTHGRPARELSLDAVRAFHSDIVKAGLSL